MTDDVSDAFALGGYGRRVEEGYIGEGDAPKFEIELYTLDENGQPDDTALHDEIIAGISEADERRAKQSSRKVMLRQGFTEEEADWYLGLVPGEPPASLLAGNVENLAPGEVGNGDLLMDDLIAAEAEGVPAPILATREALIADGFAPDAVDRILGLKPRDYR